MQATPNPRLSTLYYNDFPFKRAVNTFAAGLIVGVGIFWATDTPSAVPGSFVSPEQVAAPYIVAAACVMAACAALFGLWRYRWIQALLRDGVVVQGRVEAADRYAYEGEYSYQYANRHRYRYTYAVRVAYQLHGLDYRKRFKLPLAPSHFGVQPEQNAELRVRADRPKAALLLALYRD